MVIRQRLVASSLGLALVGALAMSCGEKKEDDKSEEEEADGTGGVAGNGGSGAKTTVVVSGILNVGAALNLAAPKLDEIKLYCVTFGNPPVAGTSEFSATGAFSVTLPKGVAFGCFVNEKATGKTVATFVRAAVDTKAFGDGETETLALDADAELGTLTLGENGKVSIPVAVLTGKVTTAPAATLFDKDLMHDTSYTMKCVETGVDATSLATCRKDITNGQATASVYFRILKGKRTDGSAVRGLAVWASKDAFVACGSIDMPQALRDGLKTKEGIDLDGIAVGANFTYNDTTCKQRGGDNGGNGGNDQPQGLLLTIEGDGEDNGDEQPQDLYALNELRSDAFAHSFREEDHHAENRQNGACNFLHSTGISFTGSDAASIQGAFKTSEKVYGPGCTATDLGYAYGGTFNVEFTKK